MQPRYTSPTCCCWYILWSSHNVGHTNTLEEKIHSCVCHRVLLPGSYSHTVDGVVGCGNTTHRTYLKSCYCMSYIESSNSTVVGACVYTCSSRYIEWCHRTWSWSDFAPSKHLPTERPQCRTTFTNTTTTRYKSGPNLTGIAHASVGWILLKHMQ